MAKPQNATKQIAKSGTRPSKNSSGGHWVADDEEYWSIKGNLANFVAKHGEDEKFDERITWVEGNGKLGSLLKPASAFWILKLGDVGVRGVKVGIALQVDYSSKQEILYFGDIETVNGPKPYGPVIRSGDEIGILVTFTHDRKKVKVYFYHNGQCLGEAADITINMPTAYKGVQIVANSVRGKGTIVIKKSNTIPTAQKRASNIKYVELEGAWKLKKGSVTENGVHLDERGFENTTMRFTLLNDTVYELDRKLCNLNIVSYVEKTPTSWKSTRNPRKKAPPRGPAKFRLPTNRNPVSQTKAEESQSNSFQRPLKLTTSAWIHWLSGDPESAVLNKTGDLLTLSGTYLGKTGVISFVRYDDYSGPLIVPEIPH